MTIQSLVGQRVLITVTNGRGGWNGTLVEERRIVELSPSAQWVKVMDLNGRKYWVKTSDMAVVEVLTIATTEPRPPDV